jgi:DNA-binding CsgD family transcriptional regulator/tetratricopeptide (TPR) repeat protein
VKRLDDSERTEWRPTPDAGVAPPGWRNLLAVSLFERDTERRLLRRLVADVRAGASAVAVITGQGGLGRTALLRLATACGAEAGLRTVAARSAWIERSRSNAVSTQFLAAAGCPPVSNERYWLSSQRFIEEVRGRPLLLLVDDMQWMDEESRHWLKGTAWRLAGTPVLILMATTGAGRSALVDTLLDVTTSRAHVLTLRALTATGVRQVIESRYDGCVDEDFVTVASETTGGNPGVLHAALDEFGATGIPPIAQYTDLLASLARTARRDQIAMRVARVPEELLPLVRILAARGLDLGFGLAWTLAGRPGGSQAAARCLLEDTGLEILAQPLQADEAIMDQILATMDARERGDIYVRMAKFGHHNVIDDALLARMLLAAPPLGERWAGDLLRKQATVVRTTSDQTKHVAALLRRALAEPADPLSRARLLCDLGSAEVLDTSDAGDRRFVEVLNAKSVPVPIDAQLAAADLLLARGNLALAQQAIGRAWSQAHATDTERVPLTALYWVAEDAQGFPSGERSLSAVPALPDWPADPAGAGAAAWQIAQQGTDAEKARALARVALDVSPGSDWPVYPRIQAVRALLLTEDLPEAASGIEAVIAEAHRRRADLLLADALLVRAEWNLLSRRVDEAAEDLASSLAGIPLHCLHPSKQPAVVALDIAVKIERGSLDQAERTAWAESVAGAQNGRGWAQQLFYKGVLRLSGGKPRPALTYFQEAGRRLLNRRWLNPAMLPWRTFAAVAHLACGRPERAGQLVDAEIQLAKTWGTPGVVAHAQLGNSLVLGRGIPADTGVESLAITRDLAWPQLFALLGEAVGHIRDTVDLQPATGACAAEPVELSPAEQRTAALAAEGRSNGEVAHELGITKRTVESHLTNVYRKLGIAGRVELSNVLALAGVER